MTERLTAILAEELRPLIAALVRRQVTAELDERLPRWLTVAQAAQRIGIGPSAVRERIRQGVLPARKWEGRWYVASADIDAAIAAAPSATVTPYFNHKCPREVATSGGAATRKEP